MNLALSGKVECFSSKELISEFKKVVLRDFLIPEEEFSARLLDLLEVALLVEPKQKVFAVKDADDNKVLEAALEANADFIVSEDKHLLGLCVFKGIRIVSAKDFLELFALQNL